MNAKTILAGTAATALVLILACTWPPAVILLFTAVFTLAAVRG